MVERVISISRQKRATACCTGALAHCAVTRVARLSIKSIVFLPFNTLYHHPRRIGAWMDASIPLLVQKFADLGFHGTHLALKCAGGYP